MLLITLLILMTSIVSILALGSLWRSSPAQQRLVRLADGTPMRRTVRDDGGLLRADTPAWVRRLIAPFAGKAASSTDHAPQHLHKRLIEAGYRRPSAVTIYLGTRMLTAILLPLLVTLNPFVWKLEQLQLVVLVGLMTGLGYVLPSAWIDRRRAQRKRAIERGLPDALDLMVVCVQAGLGISAGLARVARELALTHPILIAELQLSLFEIRAGKSTAEGLRGMAERTGVSEVSALVAMLIQTERFGTNIADTLRVHADSMRTRRMQRAEELAAKAPLKMLFPTTLIFASTLIVSMGPAILEIVSVLAKK